MPPYRLSVLLTAAAVTLLAACSGGSDSSNDGGSATCSEQKRKQFVLDVAREWYLYPELLPATVDIAAFADAEALLEHLTAGARAERKDRYFSYLTTRTADDALFGDGQFVGFGLRTRTEPSNRAFITEVFESSPAADGGLARGDEILAVDSGSGFQSVDALLAAGGTIGELLGPAEAGVSRGLRLLRDGTTRDVTLSKRAVTIDPVSDVYGTRVLPLAGTAGIGYVNLRSYVSTADAQLRDAFAQFRALGIDYFIIDLRYNGGGLVATAELLGDLLGGARTPADVLLRTTHNAARARENSTRNFRAAAQSVRPVRIAFLTSGSTASASEININTMAPWVEIAIVGDDTFGKPVGQYAFDLAGCDDRLRLITFRTENADGRGDYYDGLAGTLPYACAAEDTLDEPLGSVSEGLTAEALAWLGSGACSRVIPLSSARAKQGITDATDGAARPDGARAERLWLPGVD